MNSESDQMSLFQTGAIPDRKLFGRFLDDRGVSDSSLPVQYWLFAVTYLSHDSNSLKWLDVLEMRRNLDLVGQVLVDGTRKKLTLMGADKIVSIRRTGLNCRRCNPPPVPVRLWCDVYGS